MTEARKHPPATAAMPAAAGAVPEGSTAPQRESLGAEERRLDWEENQRMGKAGSWGLMVVYVVLTLGVGAGVVWGLWQVLRR